MVSTQGYPAKGEVVGKGTAFASGQGWLRAKCYLDLGKKLSSRLWAPSPDFRMHVANYYCLVGVDAGGRMKQSNTSGDELERYLFEAT